MIRRRTEVSIFTFSLQQSSLQGDIELQAEDCKIDSRLSENLGNRFRRVNRDDIDSDVARRVLF
ncbi:MAG: hypothetical protein ACI9HK_000436 [Pirellulaceae bacterium]|jgi:hypothetical protein